MKRFFREFILKYKFKNYPNDEVKVRDVTINFNRWFSKAKIRRHGIIIKRFNFPARTNKHVVRKWLLEYGM